MTRKVLFCANVDSHLKMFHLPYMKWFQDNGWEVHAAAKGDLVLPCVDKKYNLPIKRSPISINNIRAYKELKKIIDDNQYQIIHCHTPMGGLLVRLAARQARKSGTKVLYTAHGFHFCEGAPLINWLLYYPLERSLARCTDCLITINREDYHRVVDSNFKANQIEHVHGVGVDTEKFSPIDERTKNKLRRELGLTPEDFILFYAAEFNKNKNQHLLIKSVANLKKDISNIKLLMAGGGPSQERCRLLAVKEGIQDKVEFLGYRNDVDKLLRISDVAVASSLREGLPVNMMEAMACGLPLVASSNRGHRELIADGVNGYIVQSNDDLSFSEKLHALYRNPELRRHMGNESVNRVVRYNLTEVSVEMRKIYSEYMQRCYLEVQHGAKSKHSSAGLQRRKVYRQMPGQSIGTKHE